MLASRADATPSCSAAKCAKAGPRSPTLTIPRCARSWPAARTGGDGPRLLPDPARLRHGSWRDGAIVVETWAKVKAEARILGESARLTRMFEQALDFMALTCFGVTYQRLGFTHHHLKPGFAAHIARCLCHILQPACWTKIPKSEQFFFWRDGAYPAQGDRFSKKRRFETLAANRLRYSASIARLTAKYQFAPSSGNRIGHPHCCPLSNDRRWESLPTPSRPPSAHLDHRMFRKLFAPLLICASTLNLGSSATAAETSVYSGIGIVAAKHEYGSFYFDNGDSTRTEKGAQIYLGYQLNATWSAEAGYTDFGKSRCACQVWGEQQRFANVEAHAESWYLAGKARYRVSENLALFGKLGLAVSRNSVSSALPNTYGAYSSRKALYAAVGMEYMITSNVAVALAYERYGRKDDYATGRGSGAVTLGVNYAF